MWRCIVKLKLLPIANGFSTPAFPLGGMFFLTVLSVVSAIGWFNIVCRFAVTLAKKFDEVQKIIGVF